MSQMKFQFPPCTGISKYNLIYRKNKRQGYKIAFLFRFITELILKIMIDIGMSVDNIQKQSVLNGIRDLLSKSGSEILLELYRFPVLLKGKCTAQNSEIVMMSCIFVSF